jgi:DNA repair protein RecO (recombination protein O)
MPTEKALAIVLRAVEWSETSSIVTLWTREFGKVRGVAKGARRPKGPFESALDLLSTCRIVFLRKSTEALDLLYEAKLERRFRPRAGDLTSLYAGYYVAELLNELTDDYDPHPELFDAAQEALVALAQAGSIATVILRFELLTLTALGHMPSLSRCVECGQPIQPAGRVAFGLVVGGVLCRHCRPGKTQVVSVSEPSLDLLSRLAEPANSSWRGAEIDRRLLGELRGLMNGYVAHLLGHRPQMHRYLRLLAE